MSATINTKELTRFLTGVDQEILLMQAGESKFRSAPLHFEKDKNSAPVINRLRMFREDPTKKNLEEFLLLAKQDLGAPCAEYFESLSRRIFKVPLAEAQKRPPKPFDVAIKDGFYDMFRAAHLPLDPKQVETIDGHARKLARVIQAEVVKEVNTQLTGAVAGQIEAIKDIIREEVTEVTIQQVKLATKEICASIDAQTPEEIAAEERLESAVPDTE